MEIVELKHVFGVRTPTPNRTYVDRAGLDARFRYFLDSGRHLVVYGASKQGKTSLWKRSISEGNFIHVQCSRRPEAQQLYEEVLGQLGITISTSTDVTWTTGGKVGAEAGGKAGIPFVTQGEAKGTTEVSIERVSQSAQKTIGKSAEHLTFVAEQIKKSAKKVILEDFHYIPEATKVQLAIDLKALLELGVALILIGAWKEQNVLIQYNGDLAGRIDEINLNWDDQELNEVLTLGEKALNITLGQEIRQAIVSDASGNVGLLQRMAEKFCIEAQIFSTSTEDNLVLEDMSLLQTARKAICQEEAVRYRKLGWSVTEGFANSNPETKRIYMYIIQACVNAPDSVLLAGISEQEVIERIQSIDPSVRSATVKSALRSVDKLQSVKEIYPVIVSFDPVNRVLHLADRELLYYRKYGGPQWPWEDAE
jgi:hypothetical protein